MERLTYDAKGMHFCDYPTREIINRLAECEIMLEKIEQIVEHWACCGNPSDSMIAISEVIEDGNDD
jgi:hypothetical protein